VALVEGLPRNAAATVLARLGSEGIIFVNPEERLNDLIVTSTWGTPSLLNYHRLPDLPVVEIRKSAGEAIRALLAQGPLQIRLGTETDSGWRPMRLAVARIPGFRDDSPYVLFGGHIDAWHHGATDEGASNALMLDLALAFHAQQDLLNRGLVVAWWPGHSNARYAGSTWFADHFFEDLRNRAVAYVNIDLVGQMGAELFGASATASLARLGSTVIRDGVGADIMSVPPGRNSDQSFNGIGLPLLQLHHTRPPEAGGTWWWHTPEDDFDKIDFQVLKTDADLYAHALLRILRPISRILYVPVTPYHPDSGVGWSLLPGLAPVSILSNERSESDRFRFAEAFLIRERNRLIEALDRASREAGHLLELLESQGS
jgi:aminopeptidase YwaD